MIFRRAILALLAISATATEPKVRDATEDCDPEADAGTEGTDWCARVRQNTQWRRGRTTCTTISGQPGHRVKLLIQVDSFGGEISGKITGPASLFMNNGSEVKTKCMPPGQYKLTMLIGQGRYELTVDGKLLIKGGPFYNQEQHNFSLGHNWLDGMTDRDCEWWMGHDVRRRDWHTRCNDEYCGKSYRGLKWSARLKADAQDYANRLLDTCDEVGIHHDVTDQGENIAMNKGSEPWGCRYPADHICKLFVDNEEFWGWNRNAHLTQAMWYSTEYVGCAESKKNLTESGEMMCRFQVCRYARAGNCQMSEYDSATNDNWWRIPMMMDESPCGPTCPPGNVGCHH